MTTDRQRLWRICRAKRRIAFYVNLSAVVLCADILGYSGLIGTDEEGTQAALTIWRDFVDRRIEA